MISLTTLSIISNQFGTANDYLTKFEIYQENQRNASKPPKPPLLLPELVAGRKR